MDVSHLTFLGMRLPKDDAERQMFFEALQIIVQKGKILVATPDMTWRVTGRRHRPVHPVRLPPQLQGVDRPFVLIKYLSGNRDRILAEVEHFLQGPEAFCIDETTKDPWNRRLPKDARKALSGVSLDGLNVSREAIFRWLGEVWGGLLASRISRARRKLLEGDNPVATIVMACNPANARQFAKYLDTLQANLWQDFVAAAVKRLKRAETEANEEAASSEDQWLPPLPKEFVDVEVAGSASFEEVLQAVKWLSSPRLTTQAGWGKNFFANPAKALSAVVHISFKQSRFKEHEGIIRPRWKSWLQTARLALPTMR